MSAAAGLDLVELLRGDRDPLGTQIFAAFLGIQPAAINTIQRASRLLTLPNTYGSRGKRQRSSA